MKMTRTISKLSEQFRCIALSKLPFEEAVDTQEKALSRFGPVAKKSLNSWSDAVGLFTPLRTFPRHYLVAALGDWSLVLCDMIGECCLVDVHFHSRQTGCRAVGGIALPTTRRFFYGEGCGSLRDIECFLEGRWRFRQTGDLLAIERPECYTRLLFSERLTAELVFDYISAVTGISFPLGFGAAPSRLVSLERSWHQLCRTPQELSVANDLEISNFA